MNGEYIYEYTIRASHTFERVNPPMTFSVIAVNRIEALKSLMAVLETNGDWATSLKNIEFTGVTEFKPRQVGSVTAVSA